MHTSPRRLRTLLGLAIIAVPLTAAGIASACTALATLSLSSSSARAGDTITVVGKHFAAHDPSDARTEPARVRFDSYSGPVVGTASPGPATDSGSFSVQITVPDLAPGEHVLVVTQNGTDGRPAYGTPARHAFTVLAPEPPAATGPEHIVPPGVVSPLLTQPVVAPTVNRARGSLTRAITNCRRRYRVASARTRSGKRRMARRRAACIASARARFS